MGQLSYKSSIENPNITITKTVLASTTQTASVPVAKSTGETLQQAVHRLSTKYDQDEFLVNKIIKCESSMYKSATHVNRNGTTDYGPLQINSVHSGKMQAMGLSIYKWEDSLEFGFMLLKRNGTRDWSASKSCWSR